MTEQLSVKVCCTCKVEKPVSDFSKLSSNKDGLQYRCKTCHAEARRKSFEANKEKQRTYFRQKASEFRARHKDDPDYRERLTEERRRWSHSDRRRELNKQWKKQNKGKVNADSAKRRAAKLQAVPKWFESADVKEMYEKRPEGYHVDHIYPLISNWVCGLHCMDNLQYLPEKENLSKSNRRVQDRAVVS